MPLFKTTSIIKSIPLPGYDTKVLANLIKEFNQHLPTGIFFVPGWKKITDEPFTDKNLNLKGSILKLTYNPNNDDLTQIKNSEVHQAAFSTYDDLQPGLTAHLIFTINKAGKIDGFATDLNPEVFRTLMYLSLKSMAFYKALKKTAYWLPNLDSPENKMNLKFLSHSLEHLPPSPQIRAQELTPLIGDLYNLANGSELCDSLIHEQSWKQIKVKAYKNAQQKGYQGSKEQFEDPLDPLTIAFVKEQIVDFLVKNEVLKAPTLESDQKKSLLFVGIGSGVCEAKIQEQYPEFECFGVESLKHYADKAKKRIGADRIFAMTLQELALLDRENNNKLYRAFDKVIVLNMNVRSDSEGFMKALNYFVAEHGQVVISTPFSDTECGPDGNIGLQQHMINEFGESVRRIEPDYTFAQRLFIAQGSGQRVEEVDEKEASEDRLTVKINGLGMGYADFTINGKTKDLTPYHIDINMMLEMIAAVDVRVRIEGGEPVEAAKARPPM